LKTCEGKRPLGISRHKWKIMLKLILKKQFEGVDWIHMTQVGALWWTLIYMVMGSVKGREFLDQLSYC
jgi:hypothetical protein